MTRLIRWLAPLLVAVTWLLAGHAQARGPSKDAIARMVEDVGRIAKEERIPGVGIALITQEGVRMAGGVGYADIANERQVGPDTCFRVGSITKSFIALTVLRLVERGELELDRPIHEYAPNLVAHNPWMQESPVTLAHVLEHTAGFDDMRFNESGSERTPEMSVTDALAINPKSRTSRWRPGTKMAYANPGTTVAAAVIEEVTGQPFEQVVQREVLEPLDIAPAGFRRTPQLDACVAQGYGDDATPLPYWVTPHRPAGHLTLSPRQLAKLVHMFVRRGEGLVGSTSIDRMERPGTRTHAIDGLAYGLANYGDFSLPSPSRGHNGGLPGFISEYKYFPELGIGWVLLYNTSSPRVGLAHQKIRRRVFRTLAAGKHIESLPQYDASPEELEAWVGSYQPDSPRHEIFAFVERLTMSGHIALTEDDTLTLELGMGARVPLVPVGPNQLSIPGFSGPIVERFDDGTVLLGDTTYQRRPRIWINGRAAGVHWAIRIVTVAPLLLLLPLLRRRRRGEAFSIVVAPAVAVLSLWLVMFALRGAVQAGVLGELHPWTMLLFIATLLAPASAGIATARSLRAWRSYNPLLARLVAMLISFACFGLVVWLHGGHVIGLRTWAW